MPPRKKTNSELKLKGSRHTRTCDSSAAGTGNAPAVPAWMDCEESKKLYKKLAKELHQVGLVKAHNADLLAVYASTMVRVQQQIASGDVKSSLLGQLRTLGNDLLLTESSRKKLGIEEPQPKEINPFAAVGL